MDKIKSIQKYDVIRTLPSAKSNRYHDVTIHKTKLVVTWMT